MNKMTKSAVASAIIAAGCVMAAPASAEQYVNAQIAISEIDNYTSYYNAYSFDNGISVVGTYGMTLPAVHKFFGIEAEVSKSIANPESDGGYWWGNTHAEYDYYTAAAYAVFTIPVHEKINVRARGGLAYNHWEITTNDTSCGYWFAGFYYPAVCNYSGSDINPSISGGATYNFNSNINFMAELTAIDAQEGHFHLSAGAQFKF